MRKFNRSSLRRLARGRVYTTMQDIRRYFALETQHEEAVAVEGPRGRVFVCLPARAAAALAQLWHEGKIDVHLSLLVRAPVIEGIFSTEPPVRLGYRS